MNNFVKGLLLVACYLFLKNVLLLTSLNVQSASLLTAFILTIGLIILKPYPMGSIAFFSLSFCLLFGLLEIEEALAGFSSPVVWLVLSAFFISKGMSKTGLGSRLGLIFIYYFGKTPLGLAYSLTFAELLIAPTIPSVTARSAGVIYPIITNLSESLGSHPDDGGISSKKIGTYLTLMIFHVTVTTSAMFLTAMAANPLLASLTNELLGAEVITFSSWLKMSFFPGVLSCLFIPWFLLKVLRPTMTTVQGAKEFAKNSLQKMGPISRNEKVMLFVMCFLLAGWILGSSLKIPAVTVALAGLSLLILSHVLKWSDITGEKTAWDTFVWFAILLMLAKVLKSKGAIDVISASLVTFSQGLSPMLAVSFLMLAYFYSHYFFAMTTAHISAMFLPFATTIYMLSQSTLPLWQLIFLSNLFGGLTHYSIGPAPILYAQGYVSLKTWWAIGFLMSLMNLLIWCVLAPYWWAWLI
jgi:DASS family divalent anion:Na+ symporter